MKNFLALALVCAAPVVFAACDNEVDGVVTAQQSITFIDHKDRQITLSPGMSVAAHIDVDGAYGEQKVKIKLKDVDGGKDRDIKMELPAKANIPANGGAFAIEGASVGQLFDMTGSVVRSENITGPFRTTEGCTTYESVYRCGGIYGGRYGGYRNYCGYETIAVSGQREVSYSVKTVHVDVIAQFRAGGSIAAGATDASAPLATFTGSRDFSDRMYDYTGACLNYGYRRW